MNYVYKSPARKNRDRLISNIQDRKLRLLEPLIEGRDPYIISILIALAQAQRHEPVVERSCSMNSNAGVVQDATKSIKVRLNARHG